MSKVSKSDLRKFGLSVGGVFVVLGLLSWLRGHDVAPRVLWVLGGLLVVPGAVAPALLAPIQRAWMSAAGALGYVNTRIILAVFFYLALAPFGLVRRLVRDPLNRSMNDDEESVWVRRTTRPIDPRSYEQQF